MIVYDITNRESFTHVETWMSEALEIAGSNIVLMLVGTHTDKENERKVTREEGKVAPHLIPQV